MGQTLRMGKMIHNLLLWARAALNGRHTPWMAPPFLCTPFQVNALHVAWLAGLIHTTDVGIPLQAGNAVATQKDVMSP